jgi:hypothetical protein
VCVCVCHPVCTYVYSYVCVCVSIDELSDSDSESADEQGGLSLCRLAVAGIHALLSTTAALEAHSHALMPAFASAEDEEEHKSMEKISSTGNACACVHVRVTCVDNYYTCYDTHTRIQARSTSSSNACCPSC